MRILSILLMALFSVSIAGCASHSSATEKTGEHHAEDEPRPYHESRDAHADIEDALATIKANGKMGLFVFGANWCHDSRGLAAQFEKPRMSALIRDHYELVYVDVGQKNRNIDLAQTFGVESIVGTPTVFVTDSDGEVLNLDTAPTWRNASERSDDEIWTYFREFAHPKD